MPGTAAARIIRFGDYEIDLPARQLRKHGVKLRLREQSVEVLAVLLENSGEVVTREDLRRRLWSEDVFVDFDNSLNSAVARLREALNDSSDRPHLIETLPRRGYRFIGSISKPSLPRPRLLVLPFANVSGDPAEEYFCDAVTDEIIARLAALAPQHLAVIARTTAMHYKGSDKDIARIGRELHLDYVVEGSARRDGDRIGVNVQLIQASDQTQLWAKTYNAGLPDVFTVENAVAQAVAAQIGITALVPARKPTEDLEAYDLYIQGRHHFETFKLPEGFAKARQCFEQAVARDPRFALAYESLAELCYYLGFFGLVPPKEALSAGIFHVLRAVEIDNTLAETHALLAQYRKQLDYDWAEVRREMKRALELNPDSPVVKLRYAMTELLVHDRIDEAIRELEGALESDPLARFPRVWLGVMLWLERQYDRAIEQGRLLLGLDPTYYLGHFVIGLACREMRRFDEAVAAQRKAVELSGGAPMMVGWLGLALAQSGNTAESRSLLERLHGMALKAYVPPTSFAWIHLGLGETDRFFEWMERAIDARDHMVMPIKSYPFFDPVRADPRYPGLLRRMNLKP